MEGNWVLARLRLPYRRFEIVSTLSREAAAARINGIVEPHSSANRDVRAHQQVVRRRSLKRPLQNQTDRQLSRYDALVIEGVFEPSPSGSRIRITIRLAHWGAAFVLWCGGRRLCFFFPREAAAVKQRDKRPFMAFPLAFVYVVGAIGFNFEADKARRLLEEALKTAPSGRLRQVLSNVVKPRLSRFLKVRLIGGAVGAGMIAIVMLVAPFLPQNELRVAELYQRQPDHTRRARKHQFD